MSWRRTRSQVAMELSYESDNSRTKQEMMACTPVFLCFRLPTPHGHDWWTELKVRRTCIRKTSLFARLRGVEGSSSVICLSLDVDDRGPARRPSRWIG